MIRAEQIDHALSAISPRPGLDRYVAKAESLYIARRRRERFLAADLLGEPAWDILLDLFIAARRGRVVSTSSACVGANVPATTALRWLQVLHDRGLVDRFADKRDSRRTLVSISPSGDRVIEAYLDTI
jgi:hypothetical protein